MFFLFFSMGVAAPFTYHGEGHLIPALAAHGMFGDRKVVRINRLPLELYGFQCGGCAKEVEDGQ